ncbi:GFA family protein [uncultured Shimia sp.]|uniref:GFA family protein n=1 Tax=uncultured Shimia sp. TaxID=573152 RepID=UPI002619D934|nr:GFA family protein [uncultured Shimia sp.]
MTEKPVKVTGGCLCGEVRFEARAFLHSGYYCHCKQCQKSSGAPAEIGIPVLAGSLRFIKGEPKYYLSSEIGQRGFCADCGSRLVWRFRDPENDNGTNLSVCSLDNPEDAKPNAHTFVDSQLPWYNLADELPRLRSEDDSDFLESFPGKQTDP